MSLTKTTTQTLSLFCPFYRGLFCQCYHCRQRAFLYVGKSMCIVMFSFEHGFEWAFSFHSAATFRIICIAYSLRHTSLRQLHVRKYMDLDRRLNSFHPLFSFFSSSHVLSGSAYFLTKTIREPIFIFFSFLINEQSHCRHKFLFRTFDNMCELGLCMLMLGFACNALVCQIRMRVS